jgi:hypothetical protein
MWQYVLRTVAKANILLGEHDLSSQPKLIPDFTAMFNNILVMKGEAKVTRNNMVASQNELVNKFHETAYKLFPAGNNSIPAVMTGNEAINLYSITYFNQEFILRQFHQYYIDSIHGRVKFITDLFKILRWIMSQTEPIEGFHLVTGVRTKTTNGHHVTLLYTGLLKELDTHKLDQINLPLIGEIYAPNLSNVEHGRINNNSITITRVGSRLRDAFRVRHMNHEVIYQQIQQSIEQMHACGYPHCDICLDNIFVRSIENDGLVFIGNLEYCRRINEPPPTNIRRADESAKTTGQLDNIQLRKLKDKLGSM